MRRRGKHDSRECPHASLMEDLNPYRVYEMSLNRVF